MPIPGLLGNKKEMKYIKYMPYHSMKGASRNRREISAALECGYQVSAFSRDTSRENTLLPDSVDIMYDGEVLFNYSTPKWKRVLLILRNYIVILVRTTRLDADVLSCHDLKALNMAYWGTCWKRKKPKLIYDSHEFELGRNAKRSRLQRLWIKWQERFLMRRCAFSIMVNDSIADEVQRIHKLKQRPIVVRSTPEKWIIDTSEIQRVQAEFRKVFGNENPILMYHGAVTPGRGIEKLLEIVKNMPEVNAVILGDGAEPYMNSLKKTAEEYGITKRIMFHPAVSIRELWKYVGAADIGMLTIPAVAKSYYYMLPNKLFENVHSGTPIIGSDFPETSRLVKQYGLGLLCDPDSTEDICACVNKMLADKELYNTCKRNTLNAKEELCWEKEKIILKDAFRCHLEGNAAK